MGRYRLYLKHIIKATLDIEADSMREAHQKWLDGRFRPDDIQPKDTMADPTWDMDRIVAIQLEE